MTTSNGIVTPEQTQFMARNVALYPWLRFFINLLFWQAIWFLYFQETLSATEALLLFVVSDMVSTVLEVPSGWFSDRFGRRLTLIIAGLTGALGGVFLGLGETFAAFAIGQALLGASMAFVSGTDSAVLYESLQKLNRAGDVEAEELRGMRYTFAAMAVSAVLGGGLAVVDSAWAYIAYALAMAAAFVLACLLREPLADRAATAPGFAAQWHHLREAFGHPVLGWLLCLSLLMYAYSHIPFVFGQPYIAEVLRLQDIALPPELVSGAVAAVMTILPFASALIAPGLRARIGLAPLLLLAFAIHLAIAAALAISSAPWVIAVLFLRRVPDSLFRPFVVARAQPLLSSDSRATYLSLVSLFGRLFLSGALLAASGSVRGAGQMPYEDLQRVLAWFFAAGILCFVALVLAARRIPIEGDTQ
ncbi:MAG: MFS transporter [Pseudomonadota bacterium]